MKDLKIYYIDQSTADRDSKEFRRYWELTNYDEETEVVPDLENEYTLKWDGVVDDQVTLGKIYNSAQNGFETNVFFPGRSMMIGDVLEFDGDYFIVARVGFIELDLEV